MQGKSITERVSCKESLSRGESLARRVSRKESLSRGESLSRRVSREEILSRGESLASLSLARRVYLSEEMAEFAVEIQRSWYEFLKINYFF